MYFPLLKSGIPPALARPSGAGRNTRWRVAGIAKNTTNTPSAIATHIQERWLGRLSEICTLRGPETVELGACVIGGGVAVLTREPCAAGSASQASSSRNNSVEL